MRWIIQHFGNILLNFVKSNTKNMKELLRLCYSELNRRISVSVYFFKVVLSTCRLLHVCTLTINIDVNQDII